MRLISTTSFRLAINEKGSDTSERMLLVLPGRLDTKDYECFNTHLDECAKLGWYAVSFDPPATWDSPGNMEIYTTTNYIKAVHELVEFFGNKETVLLGHSRGATISILAGSENPHVKGYVAIMPSYGAASKPSQSAIKIGYDVSTRDLPPGTSKTKERKEFHLPVSYFTDAAKYNAASVLQTSRKPKLLFYGTNDEFTSVDEAEEVFKSVHDPKMIHRLQTTHDYRYYPEIVKEVNEAVKKFLNMYFAA